MNAKSMKSGSADTAQFLNVDLNVYSRYDLQPLADALGNRVNVLYCGRERGLHALHLELSRQFKTADECIRAFTLLIRGLRGRKKNPWAKALRRDFNIGVQVAAQGHQPFLLGLSSATLKMVSSFNARVFFTVYRIRGGPGPDTQTVTSHKNIGLRPEIAELHAESADPTIFSR